MGQGVHWYQVCPAPVPISKVKAKKPPFHIIFDSTLVFSAMAAAVWDTYGLTVPTSIRCVPAAAKLGTLSICACGVVEVLDTQEVLPPLVWDMWMFEVHLMMIFRRRKKLRAPTMSPVITVAWGTLIMTRPLPAMKMWWISICPPSISLISTLYPILFLLAR